MAEKTFKLEIITPRRVIFSGDVVSFSAPGVLGGFQVLYNHAPLLAAIGIGEAKLKDVAGAEFLYATSGGFVDVLRNHVTFLAETAERSDEIDIPRARAAKERANGRISGRNPDTDLDRARVALQRALNRIRIAGRNS
ncbi:MAG TPA: F0F1 ATP synthase subunit epsilon [Bacteroidota bacterium]|nr:F0F1 ATP synthase subunit epsilon [Bacteroidota bacterium]